MSDRCQRQACVEDPRYGSLLVPCSLPHGHAGPCLDEEGRRREADRARVALDVHERLRAHRGAA